MYAYALVCEMRFAVFGFSLIKIDEKVIQNALQDGDSVHAMRIDSFGVFGGCGPVINGLSVGYIKNQSVSVPTNANIIIDVHSKDGAIEVKTYPV